MKIGKLFQNETIEHKAKKFYDSKTVRRLRRFNHPIVRAHVIDKVNFIKKNIKLTPRTKVLEVGAGNGYFSFYFKDSCDLLVTDINKETLLLNPVKKKKMVDANKIHFEDKSFDAVMCFCVLHHVDNPNKVVKELKRISRKYVVLVEPNGDNIVQKLVLPVIPREWGIFKFNTNYFKNLIKSSHLKILKFKHIGRFITPNIPLPLLLVKRFPYSSSPQLNFHNLAICKK
jgi:ubiquinone/menaquinone biosynthesis C-methylase UbiE